MAYCTCSRSRIKSSDWTPRHVSSTTQSTGISLARGGRSSVADMKRDPEARTNSTRIGPATHSGAKLQNQFDSDKGSRENSRGLAGRVIDKKNAGPNMPDDPRDSPRWRKQGSVPATGGTAVQHGSERRIHGRRRRRAAARSASQPQSQASTSTQGTRRIGGSKGWPASGRQSASCAATK